MKNSQIYNNTLKRYKKWVYKCQNHYSENNNSERDYQVALKKCTNNKDDKAHILVTVKTSQMESWDTSNCISIEYFSRNYHNAKTRSNKSFANFDECQLAKMFCKKTCTMNKMKRKIRVELLSLGIDCNISGDDIIGLSAHTPRV